MRPENIQAWAEGVEFGHPPAFQPFIDDFGTLLVSARKTAPSNQDAEAHLNKMRKQIAEKQELERVSRQQTTSLPNAQKIGPSNLDVEAHLNNMRRQNVERQALESVIRQQKRLFPNKGPKAPSPEPRPYQIPRKPIPKSNDTTPPPPQAVLLRNGETKRLDKLSTYAERVRHLGYPEALCPLPMTEAAAQDTREVDCTSGKIVKEQNGSQICHLNGELNTPGYTDDRNSAQDPFLAPEPSPSPGKALALRPANPNSLSKTTPIFQHIVQPSTAHSTSSTDHHLIENGMRRLSAGANLSYSDAVRRVSNTILDRMAVSIGDVRGSDSRKG